MKKIFNYIAIPCVDYERALTFYSAITDGRLKENPGVPFPMAYFTDADGNHSGHIFQHPNFKPSADGPIVYLELADDLNDTLAKIVEAGGNIVMPKTLITQERGYWALFIDTEGNRLALHSKE